MEQVTWYVVSRSTGTSTGTAGLLCGALAAKQRDEPQGAELHTKKHDLIEETTMNNNTEYNNTFTATVCHGQEENFRSDMSIFDMEYSVDGNGLVTGICSDETMKKIMDDGCVVECDGERLVKAVAVEYEFNFNGENVIDDTHYDDEIEIEIDLDADLDTDIDSKND